MEALKGAIYARVSTDKQEYKRQLAQLEDYAKRNNISIVHTFEEKESGLNSGRPEYNKLIKLGKEDIDVVLIWELSRLSRKSIEIQTDIQNFKDKGINVFIYDKGLNVLNRDGTENPTANLIIAIVSTIAQEEIKTTKARIAASRKHNVLKEGRSYTTNAAFGYTLKNKQLHINESEAVIVRKIFQLSIEGKSMYSITQQLKAEHSFRKWNLPTVKSMLENTAYYGKAKFSLKTKKVKSATAKDRYVTKIVDYTYVDCPAIITKETFDLSSKKKSERSARSASKVGTPYLLKGLMKCPYCGIGLTLDRSRHNGEQRYRCSVQYTTGKGICKTPLMKAANVDFIIWDLLSHYYKELYLQAEVEEDRDKYTQEVGVMLNLIESIKDNIINKESEVLDTFNRQEDIRLKHPNLTALYKKLDAKMSTLDKDIKRLNTELKSYQNQITDLEQRFETMASAKTVDLDNADFATKREFLSKLINYTHFYRQKERFAYHIKIYLNNGTLLNVWYYSKQREYKFITLDKEIPKDSIVHSTHSFNKVKETLNVLERTVKLPKELVG